MIEHWASYLVVWVAKEVASSWAIKKKKKFEESSYLNKKPEPNMHKNQI